MSTADTLLSRHSSLAEKLNPETRLDDFIQRRATFSINEIIEIHRQWYDNLRLYLLQDSPELLDQVKARNTHRCVLGSWMDTEGDALFSSYSTYRQLKETHEELHRTASEVIRLKQENRINESLTLLEGGFRELSQRVVQELRDLRALV